MTTTHNRNNRDFGYINRRVSYVKIVGFGRKNLKRLIPVGLSQ